MALVDDVDQLGMGEDPEPPLRDGRQHLVGDRLGRDAQRLHGADDVVVGRPRPGRGPRSGTVSAAGRLRWLEKMLVFTNPGHSTETPTSAPALVSSSWSDSDSPTTANLLAQ